MGWEEEVQEIHRRRHLAKQQGGEEGIAKQHAQGRLTVRERIDALLDPDTFEEQGKATAIPDYDGDDKFLGFVPANYVVGFGKIEGRRVVVGGEDFTLKGGSPNAAGLRKSVYAEHLAVNYKAPLVRMLEGGGGSVKGGGKRGGTVGDPVFSAPRFRIIADAMGRVPIVSIACGAVAGFPAGRLVASHFSVMSRRTAQILIGGPALVERALGVSMTKDELGGAQVHARSGVVDNLAADEHDAFAQARRFLSYLPSSVDQRAPRTATEDNPERMEEELLDAVMRSSLWARRLEKQKIHVQTILRVGLIERSRYIWFNTTTTQRRAYFLAGVGLSTGLRLDNEAEHLNNLLVIINACLIDGDEEKAISTMIEFAGIIFQISPFTPNKKHDNWKALFTGWLKGDVIAEVVDSDDPETLKFIEDAFIYKLPWGMEAVRVRGLAHNDRIDDVYTLKDFELGFAVAAVETGTLKIPAAVLMKAGFNSRIAAIKAVSDGDATFTTIGELRRWIRSDAVKQMGENPNWPTPETHDIWLTFVDSLRTGQHTAWQKSEAKIQMDWHDDSTQIAGLPVRLVRSGRHSKVFSADYEFIGTADIMLDPGFQGIVRATVSDDASELQLSYLGPEKPFRYIS